MTQLITIENRSSLTSAEGFKLADIVGHAVASLYNRSPWVEHWHATAGHVMWLPEDIAPPAHAWNLILLDDSTQAGALGYHDDGAGSNIPYSEVFIKTAEQDGVEPSAVACHEAFEMLVDPNVNDPRTVSHFGLDVIVEIADPVQGNDSLGICDFAWPAWFGLAQDRKGFSQFGSVTSAFELAPQGYISYRDATGAWHQAFGAEQTALPKWASRLPRVHG